MINYDKKNYRKHNTKNKELIKKSLKECGAGRSIVIDSEDNIIAGNGIYEQAQSLKIPTKIVETDGNELVVVKRTDLKTDDEKRKQLAVMDNSTSDSSEFDFELLSADFDSEQLGDWGVDVAPEGEDDTYTTKTDVPQYEIQGLDVTLDNLYDDTKTKNLIEEIEQSNLDNKTKEFLKIASYRHTVFDYRNIAEFYAKANKECQELMEKSALVIIDIDNAIKNGYTDLSDGIEAIFNED